MHRRPMRLIRRKRGVGAARRRRRPGRLRRRAPGQRPGIAVDKAKQSGIAIVGADNTYYTGLFAFYMEMATREGLVALAIGNGPAIVAPEGAIDAQLRHQPDRDRFPVRRRGPGDPGHRHLRDHARRGAAAPPPRRAAARGCGRDKDGAPTPRDRSGAGRRGQGLGRPSRIGGSRTRRPAAGRHVRRPDHFAGNARNGLSCRRHRSEAADAGRRAIIRSGWRRCRMRFAARVRWTRTARCGCPSIARRRTPAPDRGGRARSAGAGVREASQDGGREGVNPGPVTSVSERRRRTKPWRVEQDGEARRTMIVRALAVAGALLAGSGVSHAQPAGVESEVVYRRLRRHVRAVHAQPHHPGVREGDRHQGEARRGHGAVELREGHPETIPTWKHTGRTS